jgi:uncharacterized protein YndB with AHSA1/START domain
MEELHLSIQLPVKPEIVYRAWINSQLHRDFTGGNAVIDARNGGDFSAWDGYITGILLKLEPGTRIVQSWRTTDFHPLDPSSTLEILFEPVENGTNLVLNHTEIPNGQAEEYEKGWSEYYFEPMVGYFNAIALAMAKENAANSVKDDLENPK